MPKYLKLAVCLILPQAAGALGAIFTTNSIESWYSTLEKPVFSPPNWLFGPVWITLYFLMGISIFLIWNQIGKNKEARDWFWVFWFHLAINAIWSPIFFGLRDISTALVVIIGLWGLIALLIINFYRINKLAAYLLIPYFFWVSFATILNFSLFLLN